MSEHLIRDAAPEDLQAILDIYNHEVAHGTATWDTTPRAFEEQVEWLEAHATPYCAIVVIESDEVVAWGSLSRYHPRPGYRYTVEDTVYVRPDRQRRGLGRLVLEELILRAKGGGFHAILGKISGDNKASIELHRSLGFFEAGRELELGYKFDRWLDCVTMQLIV